MHASSSCVPFSSSTLFCPLHRIGPRVFGSLFVSETRPKQNPSVQELLLQRRRLILRGLLLFFSISAVPHRRLPRSFTINSSLSSNSPQWNRVLCAEALICL